jgi:uncharacterized protein YueI
MLNTQPLAIDQFKGLISYFKNYRENGFTFAIISSKEVTTKMEIEHVFHKKNV